MYLELAKGMSLLGVNPDMPSSENFGNLEEERIFIGEKVLKSNHAPIAQQFLKRGAPRALRGSLWSLVLGSTVKQNVKMLLNVISFLKKKNYNLNIF